MDRSQSLAFSGILYRYMIGGVFLCLSILSQAREVPLSDDDLLIVAAKIGRLQISDDLFIYYQPDFTLIPLQSFCDMLDFPIEVDPDGMSANGWFIDESRTFNLNLNEKTLYIGGELKALSENLPISGDDFDLYVDISALRDWFDLSLDLVTSQLVLEIKSPSPLPIQQRIERDKNRKIGSDVDAKPLASADIKNKYQLFSLPVVDAQMVYASDKFVVEEMLDSEDFFVSNNQDVSTPEFVTGVSRSYNVEIGGDVLYHQMSLSGNVDEASDADSLRLTLSRRGQDFGDTMWFGITDYDLGDINSLGDSLVNKGSSGVGIVFQRGLNGGREPSFTEKTIEGDAPAGWEVELYRNGVLLDFQISDETGRYRFEGAKLHFGENVFDIKIYGPQGQERSARQRVHVGSDMIKPKEWTYRGSIMKESDSLFNQATPTLVERDNADLQFEYGFNKSHSLGLGVSQSSPSRTVEPHKYIQASVLSAWPLLSTSLMLANDVDSGTAIQAATSTRLWDQDLSFEHRIFNDFFSQQNPNGTVKSQSALNLSSYISITENNGVPVNINIEQTQFNDGASNLLAKALTSGSIAGIRLTNELNLNKPSGSTRSMRGSLNLNFIRGKWRSRSNLIYDVSPQAQMRRFSSTIDWQNDHWRCQVNANFALHHSEVDSFGFNLSRRTRFGSLSFSADRNEEGQTSAQLSVEMSFGAKQDKPWAFVSPLAIADKGRVRAQVFIDKNGNDRFDQDSDQALSGIKFSGRKEWKDLSTDENGVIELLGFNSGANSRLTLEEKSFNDPYLQPKKTSLLVSHHGGGYFNVPIPIKLITDVEGYVYLIKDNRKVPAGGVMVNIVDDSNAVVKQVKTEFDGYYYMTGVPEGKYRVVLGDRIQNGTGYTVNTPMAFQADSDLGIVQLDEIEIVKN